eukprot:jgi/Bigna1/41314/e_gw1.51.10.1
MRGFYASSFREQWLLRGDARTASYRGLCRDYSRKVGVGKRSFATIRNKATIRLPNLPLFQKAADHSVSSPSRVAIVNGGAGGKELTYTELLAEADSMSSLLEDHGVKKSDRVAILTPNDESYVCAMWGVWHKGGVAVPLYNKHPINEMEYYVEDSEASAILVHPDFRTVGEQIAQRYSIPLIPIEVTPPSFDGFEIEFELWNSADSDANAMIIYTSGTTGKPKGVVTTHSNIQAMITALVEAWEWRSDDRILHFLPLHHVHGIVNKLLCALWSGASVEFSSCGAEPRGLWERLASNGIDGERPLTLFMAVPTIYSRMVEETERWNDEEKAAIAQGVKQLRLMVSGSAACPTPLMEKWEKITGHKLLERYGMTEIGMALSNSYRGTRHPGYVGKPLPGVSVRSGEQGELRVKGPCVFKEYWNRPEATRKEFDEEKWFKTGDIVRYNAELQSFAICGRASTDMIKSGGFKISALEIEREILSHESVAEVAVLGESDETWGEQVVAVIRWKGADGTSSSPSLESLQEFLKPKLASYKIPRRLYEVAVIPKNAMGKINKKTLLQQIST